MQSFEVLKRVIMKKGKSGIEGLRSKVFFYNDPYISGSLCYYHVMVVIVELTCSRSGV